MKEEIKNELEGMGSSLGDLSGTERPALPKDYFAQMQRAVLSELSPTTEAAIEPKSSAPWFERLQWLFAPKPALAFAGLAAALLAGFIFLQPAIEETSLLTELDDTTLDDYFDNNIDDFDDALLFELFADAAELPLVPATETEELYIEEALDDLDIDQINDLL